MAVRAKSFLDSDSWPHLNSKSRPVSSSLRISAIKFSPPIFSYMAWPLQISYFVGAGRVEQGADYIEVEWTWMESYSDHPGRGEEHSANGREHSAGG